MSPERPFVGFPQSKCPSISRTRTAEGTILAGRTSCPEAAAGQVPGVLTVPRLISLGVRSRGACRPASHLQSLPRRNPRSLPPWLSAITWLDLLSTDLARSPACCLPPGPAPLHAWPSQQVLSCELPDPTHAWPPSHPYLQARPGPKYSFLPSSASAESVNKAT